MARECKRRGLLNPSSSPRCDCGFVFASGAVQEQSARETSGQGKASMVPRYIRRWSWGAFWLPWIWGLWRSNRTQERRVKVFLIATMSLIALRLAAILAIVGALYLEHH